MLRWICFAPLLRRNIVPRLELMTSNLKEIAVRLDDAARLARSVDQLLEPLTIDESYEVQALSLARRYERGERRVGVKMGFTSRAKMVQMGLDEMIWGRLTDAMLVEDGGVINLPEFVHPRVEPEIAFLLNAPLSGRVDSLTAAAAIEAIAPALEIIDSRYHNFKFSLTDVISDNSSSSGFIVGPWSDPRSDFSNLGMVMEIDGFLAQVGSSAAILGHPLRSLVAAARLVAQRGEELNAGDIVLAGAATAAEAMTGKRFVQLTVERLGKVSFTIRS
jgi:2-oxo-3-hexenedioate decarboxylase